MSALLTVLTAFLMGVIATFVGFRLAIHRSQVGDFSYEVLGDRRIRITRTRPADVPPDGPQEDTK